MTTRPGRPAAKAMVRALPWLAGLLALAALWVWADRLLPRADTAGLAILAVSDCDLNLRDCEARLPSGESVSVRIEPRPAMALQPLSLEMRFSRQDPRWLDVDLAGVEMFMGHHRVRLDRAETGVYRGDVLLPVCASEAMTWSATVLPEGDAERAEFQFQFVSRR